jgi:hypothetical protein
MKLRKKLTPNEEIAISRSSIEYAGLAVTAFDEAQAFAVAQDHQSAQLHYAASTALSGMATWQAMREMAAGQIGRGLY